MKAERKETETDLFIDVFFANTLSGRDGDTPVIGQNSNWWIAGKDTGVLAKGKNGNDGNDGQTPSIGANGNWWINGQDTGIKAKAPVISIGSNGHWQIDGVDTAVPTNIDTFLSKTTAGEQSVAGKVTFNAGARIENADIRGRAYIASNQSAGVIDNWETLNVPVDAPRYILILPRVTGQRVKVILNKTPEFGDIYIICMYSGAGCRIEPSVPGVTFWYGGKDALEAYDTHQRATVILHGWNDGTFRRWYAHTIAD